MKGKLLTGTAVALVMSGSVAMADSLTPSACPGGVCAGFSPTIGVGESTSITNKVGTITAGGPTSAQADILFIADTTGSMAGPIAAIRTTFSDVITSLAGSISNLATGAAQFKDLTQDGYDPFDYNLDQAITTNAALTQAAINTWTAAGGGDAPEQGLFALSQATGASTGWRPGSKRIAVITSDVPQHDAAHPPAAGGVSVASVAAELIAANVTVEALNAGNMNGFGQFEGAGSIFDAGVDGTYTTPFPPTASLASLLTTLIGSAFSTYSTVSLDLISSSGPCTVTLPSSITGSFDRTITRTFDFGPVSITGNASGVCTFTIALEADGAILATETDTVIVGAGTGAVPEPTTLAILGAGLLGAAAMRRRKAS